MRKIKGLDPGLILIAVIVAIVIFAVFFLYFEVRTDLISGYVENKQEISVALLISGESELITSKLFVYHPETHKSALVDVPPYTSTLIRDDDHLDRMDSLYKYGSPEAYIKEMENHLGIFIPFYVEISIDNLVHLVTLIGGIEMFIVNQIEVIEEGNIVLLPSGRVNLNGDKVVTYLTYREPGQLDEEIVDRNQKIIQALLYTIGKNSEMIGKKNTASVFSRYLSTNLNKQAMISLFAEYSYLDNDTMALIETLGKKQEINGRQLLLPLTEGKMIKQSVAQTIDALKNMDIPGTDNVVVVLEILNGTDVSGLASRTDQLFKSYGYDIDIVGNADSDEFEKTVVYDRIGNITLAQRIGSIINCENVVTEEYFENTAGIDVTVILGKDFDGRYVKN